MRWIVAHVAALFLAQRGSLLMLLWLPLGPLLERIWVPPWLTGGFGWSIGGWGMVWICAAVILPAFGVKAGVPLLVMLLIFVTGNNLRRVRGALSSDNSILLQSEVGGLIGVNVGVLAGWLYFTGRGP
jgi:hypothetical protein